MSNYQIAYEPRNDEEWIKAKPYDSLPGPTRLNFFLDVLPGGKYHKTNMMEMNRQLRSTYGDIYRLKGMLGKSDIVFTYNPKDFEMVYRNEGLWPLRVGFESFCYYREKVRPDIFQGMQGLVTT